MTKFEFKNKRNHWILKVTRKGFTLWDVKASRWTIDASTLTGDDAFQVSHILECRQALCSNPEYAAAYPEEERICGAV